MKKWILFTIIFLIIVGGILVFLLLRGNNGDSDQGFFGQFFGSGSGLPTGTDTPTPGDINGTSTTPLLIEKNKLVQITDFPSFGKLVGSEIIFYRRDLGHRYAISAARAHSQDTSEPVRISNFTIPAVAALNISEEGNAAILFSLESDSTPSFFSLEHHGTSTTALLLPNSTKEAVIAPSGDRVAILEETSSGMQILLTTPDLRNPTVLYQNALRDFSLSWVSDELLLLTSRPSALRESISILVNINGNTAILINSTVALDINFAPNSNDFLYSSIENGSLVLRTSTRSGDISIPLPVRTFAEKCTWGSNEIIYCAVPRPIGTTETLFPDDWLRGEISFSDVLWKIDVKNGDTEFVANMNGFDIVNLSGNKDYLVFNNKNDSTLWSLQLFENEIPSVEVPETVEGEPATDN